MAIKDEVLFQNEWVSLKKIVAPKKGVRGYVYSHETRCHGKIVSILPYRIMGYQKISYLLREELTPCWNMNYKIVSTITGGCDHLGNIQLDALRELEEEAGLVVQMKDLLFLGTCYASKSSDTQYWLYAVDTEGKERKEAVGDGSQLEKEATTIWYESDDIADVSDPLASVLHTRLMRELLWRQD